MVEADVTAALRDVDVVDQARTYLADTASRGSTAEEREAADAWLVHAVRDEQQVEQFHQRTGVSRPTAQARVAIRAGKRNGGPVKRPAVTPATPSTRSRSAAGRVRARSARRPYAPATAHRVSQRALAYVIAAENRSGQALTLGDALAELLADITEAARTIGTILRGVRPQ